MTRKRTELGASVDDRIVALMRAGGTAASISTTLRAEGSRTSRATIGRRMREIKSGRSKTSRQKSERPKRSNEAKTVSPLPSTPDAIPEGTDLETLDRWLETADRMGETAEKHGDLGALAAAGRLSASLIEAKRKATPIAPPDLNDSPDFVKLGALVAERLFKMIDKVAT